MRGLYPEIGLGFSLTESVERRSAGFARLPVTRRRFLVPNETIIFCSKFQEFYREIEILTNFADYWANYKLESISVKLKYLAGVKHARNSRRCTDAEHRDCLT